MNEIQNDERIKTIIEEFENELDKELKQYMDNINGHKLVLINFFAKREYLFNEDEIHINLQRGEYHFLKNGIDKMNGFEEENPEFFI